MNVQANDVQEHEQQGVRGDVRVTECEPDTDDRCRG
jgi:hypothetical protein